MSNSGDAAEQVVRLSLESVETIAKISGKGAYELAKLLIAEAKKPQRTKGRASLMTMLKQKKLIKVFEIDDASLKKFCQEAKKYGVMYHVLKDKGKSTGKCDIMVRAEDASKVNRIFDRFNLGVNNKAEIRSDVVKSLDDEKGEQEKTIPFKSEDDRFIDELFKPPQREKAYSDNPSQVRTAESHPSEPISRTQKSRQECSESRPSVKKQLEVYKKEAQKQKAKAQTKTKTKTKQRTKGAKTNGR